ncbi:putative aminoglycoside phosphotransferase [Diplodia seriata]|uniref:Putative aminoglycoside phosphotransferase n=1 Tax=Diplodia seriata TaxID=420778 RepID=A0A0G2HH99_9PEZI|nr:putative aminoglycoside phosphotransferase [Diplodia seriata]
MLGTSGCKSNATDHGASSSKLRLVATFIVHDSMESLARRLRRRPDDTGGRVSPSGSTASSRKKREALKRLHSSATPSDANITVASELPSYDVSTIDFALTPTTVASTPTTSSTDSPKLNRREQMRHRLNRMLSKTGIKGSRIASLQSIRSSSSIGLGLNASAGGTGTNISDEDDDTSASGDYTPPRRMMRSSIIPNLTVTPTSDGSGSNPAGDASPAASVRTVYRVNPDTGRPVAQQVYNPSFLSPARAKTRGRTTSSPRFLSRRSSASPSPSPRSGASFPRRTSSLRHSKEFPFNPSGAEPLNDDSDLYASNPTSPVTDESSRLLPAAAASSPALVSAGGSSTDDSSPPQFNKPLPTLPRDSEQPPPISVTPLDDDDVFFDAKSPADAAADAAPSWPLPADRQSVYGGGDADTLPSPPPLPPMSAARTAVTVSTKRSFATVPVHEDLPTASIFSDRNKIDDADDEEVSIEDSRPTTMLFTPSSSSATATAAATSSNNTPSTDATIRAVTTTRERSASGSSELSLYGFHHYKPLDESVMEQRRKRIAAELRRKNIFGDNSDNNQQEGGGDSNSSNVFANDTEGNVGADGNSSSSSSTASSAVIGDGFLPLDDDEDHVAPLLPPPTDHRRRRFTSHSQGNGGRLFAGGNSNRDSVVSVMTDATGVSFVTAAEGIWSDEDEDGHDQWESTEEDDGVVGVDVDDARGDAAEEGGTESSGHPLLLIPDPPRAEHVLPHHDDVDDRAEMSLGVFSKQEELSIGAADDKSEAESNTFQIVSKDGTNSSVMANLAAVEEASSNSSSNSSAGQEHGAPPLYLAKYSNPANGHFPPQPGAGPNVDLILDQQGKIKWSPSYSSVPDPLWVDEPSLFAIEAVVAAHIRLIDLDKDDFKVEYFAEGSFNKLYTVRKASVAPGTGPEYIFRVCLPAYPWYKLESEVATMELVRMYTNIPVPKVYVFDSDAENPVRYEWMMMDKVKGIPFAEARENMDLEQKTKLAHTLADWMHQLSMLRFNKIGSIYRRREKPATSKSDFKVGPIVEQPFMADWRLEYKVHRGPYTSVEQYFRALVDVNHFDALDPRQRLRSEYCAALDELTRLTCSLDECTSSFDRSQVKKAQDSWADKPTEKEARIAALRTRVDQHRANVQDDELDTVVWDRPRYALTNVHGSAIADPFGRVSRQCQALHFALPHLCPSEPLEPGAAVLHHWDMSDNNILVDGAGAAVALVDWEQVYTLPFDLIEPYPPAIADRFELSEPPAPLKPNASPDARATHAANTVFHENFLLRAAYRARLERLRSPHLAAFVERVPDMTELLALARGADQLSNEARVEQLVESLEDEIGRGF